MGCALESTRHLQVSGTRAGVLVQVSGTGTPQNTHKHKLPSWCVLNTSRLVGVFLFSFLFPFLLQNEGLPRVVLWTSPVHSVLHQVGCLGKEKGVLIFFWSPLESQAFESFEHIHCLTLTQPLLQLCCSLDYISVAQIWYLFCLLHPREWGYGGRFLSGNWHPECLWPFWSS